MDVYKRKDSQYWWCKVKFRGKWKDITTKETNKRKARDFMRLKQAEALQGINPDYGKTTFKDLKEVVLDRYEERGNKTIKDTKRYLRDLAEFFGDIKIVNIDKPLIRQYKKEKITKGLSRATINRYLSCLRLGLNLLEEEDRIFKAPKVKTPPEHNARQMRLTLEEYLRFVEALKIHAPFLVGPVELAVATGWRKNTIMSLEWQHIDRSNKIIIAPGILTKNKTSVMYPYEEDTIICKVIDLQWSKKSDGLPYVFLSKKGTDRIKDFRKVWNKACEAANLVGGYGNDLGIRFHDLKRTNFVLNEEAGISRSVTMAMSGTKSPSTFGRYNIVDKHRRKDAIRKRQEFMNKSKKKPAKVIKISKKA